MIKVWKNVEDNLWEEVGIYKLLNVFIGCLKDFKNFWFEEIEEGRFENNLVLFRFYLFKWIKLLNIYDIKYKVN